jgi:prepilin-type processing-associated H-X9-DG protein
MTHARSTHAGSRDASRTAFTYVHFLVSIAIVALVVAMLIPSIERLREKANLVRCKDNLRQIGSALIQYARINNGDFPVSRSIENPHRELLNDLVAAHLTSDHRIYYCPSERRPALGFSDGNFNSGVIGYYYYSAENTPPDPALSKFLRSGVSWPRELNTHMGPNTWIMSDIWVSSLPTSHPGYKKGVNYLMIDGSVGFVDESPRQQFH